MCIPVHLETKNVLPFIIVFCNSSVFSATMQNPDIVKLLKSKLFKYLFLSFISIWKWFSCFNRKLLLNRSSTVPNTSHGKFGIYLPCSREKGTIFIFEIMCDCLQEYVLPGCEEIHKVLFAFFCSFLMVQQWGAWYLWLFPLWNTGSREQLSRKVSCHCLCLLVYESDCILILFH